ncbi:hypothetical protein TNCV_848871 [Trichonephila clavipes]|uniref:Uncharacterized protein n=1 Tax=Trichonephila clavipes TaxID=2585209 RepID=A0A8X6V530_TRICX|nr:hypothetical protein TNCV_848871 [Trichonephila clavipes]
MALTFQNFTIEEQQGFIQFLTAEGVKPAVSYRRMMIVYVEDCVSDKRVRKGRRSRFRADRKSLVDDPRPGQGRSHRQSRRPSEK